MAVVLSAQATDKSVNIATRELFRVAGTPEKMLALGEDGIAHYIRSIGLYRSKARHLHAACDLLLSRHHGEIPAERAALEALPGVGRKTASVVLNIAFGQPAIAVDTHIFRVANRTGFASGRTVREVEEKLMQCTPGEFVLHAHHWLILHGRYTCTARKPHCHVCPIADLCTWTARAPH